MHAKVENLLTSTGKQLYTWGTIGSFTGATGLVVLIWNVLKGINLNSFAGGITPLTVSFVVMIAFALFTEPPVEVERTTWRQKGQKAAITVANSFLVYSAALGFTGTPR